jgi:hypothetical protein
MYRASADPPDVIDDDTEPMRIATEEEGAEDYGPLP